MLLSFRLEGSNEPLPGDTKKSIDTFADTVGKDSILLRELMTCVPYQNLLTQKHDLDNQAEREYM